MTTPPRSTRALEMLLKLRKSSCCWGSDCRAVMFSRIRAAAWGGRGKEGVQTCPLIPSSPLYLVTLDLTSIHQLSQSIFSCWAVGWPSLRDLEALVGSRRKTHLGCDPSPGTAPPRPTETQVSPTASSPGQNHHHGIEVNGTVRQTLQQKLFICQVDGLAGGAVSGLEGGRGKVGVGTRLCSLTDDILLVLYQLGLHHGGKLLQSLHRLRRWDGAWGEMRPGLGPSASDAGYPSTLTAYVPAHHSDSVPGGRCH